MSASISISEIKRVCENAPIEMLPKVVEEYLADEREGVRRLLQSMQKKYEKYTKECERIEHMLAYEKRYAMYSVVCGIDEVGRGPLAGPVVAASVVLPKDCRILWLNDSKQLSEKKREELYPEILEKAVAVGVGMVSHEVIDRINILQATYQAMREAIVQMASSVGAPDVLLNDAVTIPGVDALFPERPTRVVQVPIIKGDAKSLSIAAASVVAKVTRDHLMEALDKRYPGYGFAGNKGYGSAEHIAKLRVDGPCEIHRRSFIKNFVSD